MSKPSKAEDEMRTKIARVDCGDIIRLVLKKEPHRVIFGLSHSQTRSGDSLGFTPFSNRGGGDTTYAYWHEVKSVKIIGPEELARIAHWAHEERKKKRRKK